MSGAFEHAMSAMGTVVSVQLVGCSPAIAKARAQRALDWFARVEDVCSRFRAESELRQLCATVGTFVPISDVLFELLRFSLALSDASAGAFDPTVGAAMVDRGFDRDWQRGRPASPIVVGDEGASWRDIELDVEARAVRLARPLLLDLGAVAKGLAVDLVARDLADVEHFAVDAGGDLYLAGNNAAGRPWSIGIRNPRIPEEVMVTLALSGRAVCTSGDYERLASGDGHHLLDPRRECATATTATSATVVAEHAMVADGLATAAFVMGPSAGCALLEAHGVDGLIVASDGSRVSTGGMSRYVAAEIMHA